MRTYDVNTVADFFVARANPEYGDLLTNLKLQKLVYYAAGVIAAVRRDPFRPLINERFKAWQHGPVIPQLWHRFNASGAAPIEPILNFDADAIDGPDIAIMEDVYGFYGQYSAWKLRNMTHEERPWIDAYARRAHDDVIYNEQLLEYFSGEVSEDYINGYLQAQQNLADAIQQQNAGDR